MSLYDLQMEYKEKHDIFEKSDVIVRIAKHLCEHFGIPCDLCQKYFKSGSSCPENVEKCNGEEHWLMLLERISKNEEN